jgi:hypothetical protein
MVKSARDEILSRSREWGRFDAAHTPMDCFGALAGSSRPFSRPSASCSESGRPGCARQPRRRTIAPTRPKSHSCFRRCRAVRCISCRWTRFRQRPRRSAIKNGLLAISAQNSTLGEILRDVRRLTGASIDIPQGSGANERVVTSLGPGAPRDVLAGLLNGSSFNYVMLGSNSDPRAVSSVILTAKPSGRDKPRLR